MVSIIFIFCGFAALMIAEWRYARIAKKIENWTKERSARALPGHAALQAVGYIAIAAGMLTSLAHEGPNLHIPSLVRVISLCVGLSGGAMLVWTVFIEIPFGTKKHAVEPGHAYQYGSYGVCRHPGFWWFLIFTLGLALWKNDSPAFLLFFVENTLNLLLILLQDKYTFIMQFEDYHEYAKVVPFLVPRFRQRC